ncbi:MAG TPA: phenylacetate--CoA ligase family protein [Verrucomicrobiales bacterium]|nr:phenylacetate--CoA ligase family protein [Verrucomicrobiales bacterium]
MASNRNQILEIQLEKLRELIDKCLESNPFWKTRLASIDWETNLDSVESFCKALPLLNKNELIEDQTSHPPYGTNFNYPLSKYCRLSQTSGTTGSPIRWLDTRHSWQRMIEGWKIVLEKSNFQAADRVIFPFSFGPFIGLWLAFEAAVQMECLVITGANLSSSMRLKMIQEHAITAICCTPTYAIRLGQIAKADGIDLAESSVKKIILAGEPGGSIPATRDLLLALWPNVQIYDHHGMTEVGPVTYQCPKRWGRLHVIESQFIPEIISKDSSLPVSPGEIGELVLTTLDRDASPLFRYQTGDLVKRSLGDRCECGTHELAFDGGILSRTDDMIIVRGVNIYPGAVESVIRRFEEIEEYQVKITRESGMLKVGVEIELSSPAHSPEKMIQMLEENFKSSLAIRIPVTLVPLDSLPRYELKSKRWLRYD